MRIEGTALYMTRGDTEALTVSCPNRPFSKGDIVEMTVRQFEGFGDVLLYKKVSSFTEDGKAEIYIAPQDTDALMFGSYSYDVQVTFTDLGVKTVVKPSLFVVGKENTYGGSIRGR